MIKATLLRHVAHRLDPHARLYQLAEPYQFAWSTFRRLLCVTYRTPGWTPELLVLGVETDDNPPCRGGATDVEALAGLGIEVTA